MASRLRGKVGWLGLGPLLEGLAAVPLLPPPLPLAPCTAAAGMGWKVTSKAVTSAAAPPPPSAAGVAALLFVFSTRPMTISLR